MKRPLGAFLFGIAPRELKRWRRASIIRRSAPVEGGARLDAIVEGAAGAMTTKRGNDLLLVNPPLTLQERYHELWSGGDILIPLGLCYLAAAARREGWRVGILDAEAEGWDVAAAVERIVAAAPEMVGLTAATVSIHSAAAVAREVKARLPQVRTVVGGSHVSALPSETMRLFPEFDFAVIGEGEATLVELLALQRDGGAWDQCAGIAYRQDDEVRLAAPREPIADLDSLAFPAWDLLASFPDKYLPSAHAYRGAPAPSLATSRGCHGRCIFCSNAVFGRRTRLHGADHVVGMARELVERFGVVEIGVEDDNFLCSRRRAIEICQGLIRERLRVAWNCYVRVDQVDAELLRLMREAGCWQIAFGIESGSQRVLDFLRKGTRLDQCRAVIDATRQAGIKAKGLFILGAPTETPDDVEATLRFMLETRLDDISVMYCTPLPGSELYGAAAEYGAFDNDWRKMTMYWPVFAPHGMTREQLVAARRRIFQRFYFRPRMVLEQLRRLRSASQCVKMARSAMSVARL
jgi:radical SAM superfamily enzyme YgiQ (UPF0313 family)